MKIAVFGWYGHDNAGDERIKFCLSHFLRSLGGIEEIDFFNLHEYGIRGATNQFDHYDLVIIGGGGLVLSRHNYHDFILGINTTLVVAGISIETELKGNPKNFVIALLEKSKAFLVRDKDSARKVAPFDAHNKVKVSSDLTFLEPYSIAPVKDDNILGVNLLPKPKDFKYSTLSSPHLSFVIRQFVRIGFPHILRVFDFKEIITQLEKKFSLLPVPLYCIHQSSSLPLYQKNDVEFLKLYFSEVFQLFSHNLIDECSVFLTMRLHGSIFAVQKGIPAISLSYLPKNRNFMKEVGLEEFVIEVFSPDIILDLIQKCLKERDVVRKKMALFTKNASRKIRNDLIDILNMVK
jgi:polysaccharide pyruvyl transferase WcaK-like protein